MNPPFSLSTPLYHKCRTILKGCDEFQSFEHLRAVFSTSALEGYRSKLHFESTVEALVDVNLSVLLNNSWHDIPLLLFFLQDLLPRYPEGDTKRRDLEELVQEVDTAFRQSTSRVTSPVAPASPKQQERVAYLALFIEKHDRLPKWQRVEESPLLSFSELFFIEPDLTTWSNYSSMEHLPERKPRRVQEITDLDPRQQFPSERLRYDDLLNKVLYEKTVHWVITGEPGMGKTTLLKMIGVHSAKKALADEKQVQIPIFIELWKCARALQQTSGPARTGNLYEYISGILRETIGTATPEEFRRGLEEGQYLLLFDALDEIGNPAQRSLVMSSINDFLQRYKACTILVTSRSATYGHYEMECVAKEILPLTPEQITTYIRRGLGEEHAGKDTLLIEKLVNNARLQRMLSNPMLLFMMVRKLKSRAAYDRINIPEQRVALYMDFVEYLIELRPSERHLHDISYKAVVGLSQVKQYLMFIGSTMHDWGVWYAYEVNILDAMMHANRLLCSKDQAMEHLNYLVEEIGLLHEIDRDEYTFSHFTFQEYFTGEHLSTFEPEQALAEVASLTNPWWHEVIVIYYFLSTKRHKDGNNWLLHKLLEEEDTIFATRLLLVAACLSNESTHSIDSHPLYNEVHGRLTEIYYICCQHHYYELQQRVFQAIRELGGLHLLQFLQHELEQNDEERYIRTLAALSKLDNYKREAFHWIVARYDAGDVYMGKSLIPAVDALIALDMERAKDTILHWLEESTVQEQDALIRQMVATDRDDHIAILLEYAASSVLPDSIKRLLKGKLGNISSSNRAFPRVLALYSEWLYNEQNNVQRIFLLNALHIRVDDALNEYVRSFLDEQDPELQEAAVSFLGRQQDTTSIDDKLVNLLLYEQREMLLIRLVEALERTNNPDAMFYLDEYLKEYPSSVLWKQRVRTRGEYGNMESLPMLINLLQGIPATPNPYELKTTVIEALYKIIERHVHIQKQKEILLVEGSTICECILDYVHALEYVSKHLAREVVFLVLQFALRKQIVRLLALAQEQLTLGDALISYLSQPDYLEILQQLVSDRQSGESVDIFLKHYIIDREEDTEAAEVLLRVQLSKGRGDLKQALDSPSPSQRLAALRLLRAVFDLYDEEMQDRVLVLLKDPDSQVVKEVIQLLHDLAGGQAIEPLLDVFNKRLDCKQEAFNALYSIAQRECMLGIPSFVRRHSDG